MRPASFGLALAALVATSMPAALAQGSDCPLSFTATSTSPGSVTFHWIGFGGADGYQVFGRAGLANTAGYSPLLGADARDDTRTDLAAGDYTFWVTAYHSGSPVATSCERTAVIDAGQTAPCPATVTATVQTSGTVRLSWTPVTGAAGYAIARAVDAGPFTHDYAGTTATMTHFLDTNVSSGHAYTYIVSTTNTRPPPEACQRETITLPTHVPVLPNSASWGLAGLGGASALLLVRHRRR